LIHGAEAFVHPALSGVGDPHTDVYGTAEYLFGKNRDSVALYGYLGETDLAPGVQRSFDRIGLFTNLYLPQTKIALGYVGGKDRSADGFDLNTSGLFVLGERLLNDKWSVYARYDRVRQDFSAGGSGTADGPTIGVSWWPATPIKLSLEGQILNVTDQDQVRTVTADLLWIF